MFFQWGEVNKLLADPTGRGLSTVNPIEIGRFGQH